MLSGKVMIIRLIARLMKKISLYKMSHYPGPNSHSRNKIKVELDLSNYATISDVKITASVNKPEFAKKRIIQLKYKVDDLSKLSDLLVNDILKKTVYDKLVEKVHNNDRIDASKLDKKN